jgi:hypothetical protein
MVDDEAMGVGLVHHVAHIPQNEGRGGYCDSGTSSGSLVRWFNELVSVERGMMWWSKGV